MKKQLTKKFKRREDDNGRRSREDDGLWKADCPGVGVGQ